MIKRLTSNEITAENNVAAKDHAKYNVATNNCHDFIENIFNKIKK